MPTPSLLAGVQPRVSSLDAGAPKDRALSERFRAGDEEALRAVVKGYHSRVHHAAVHLLRDAKVASRATTDAFVRTFQSRELLDSEGSIWSWLARTLVHLSLTASPREPHADKTEDPRLSTVAALVGLGRTDVDAKLYFALVDELDALTDMLRVTIVLGSIDGGSPAEIGLIVGASESAVGLRLHEARRKIRDGLFARGVFSNFGTTDATAEKKAANARIDLAFASWPQSETTSGLSSDIVERIVRLSAALPRPGGPSNDELTSAPFPDSAVPVTRIRRRSASLTDTPAPLPVSSPMFASSGRGSTPPPSSSDSPISAPASGRVSYPPPPISAEQLAAARAEFGSRPSYTPPPFPSSAPTPAASGEQPIHRPVYPTQAMPSTSPTWGAYAPPAQAGAVSAPPLSMPTLPPIPSVPNAPISGRLLGDGTSMRSVPPQKVTSPMLLVVGAFVGAMVFAGGWLVLRKPADDLTIDSSSGVATKRALAAEPHVNAGDRPRGVDPSALPVAQLPTTSRANAARTTPPAPARAAAAAPRAAAEESAPVAAPIEEAPSPAQAAEAPEPVAATKEAAPKHEVASKGAEPSLNDLIKQAVVTAPTEAPQKAAEKPTEEPSTVSQDGLAARPSFGAVQSALRKVLPAARGCLQPGDGVTHATVRFGPSGGVDGIDLSGAAAGGPSEPCVRDALKSARVQPFTDAVFAAPVTVRPL